MQAKDFLLGDVEPVQPPKASQGKASGAVANAAKYPSAGPASGARPKAATAAAASGASDASAGLDRPYFVARMDETGQLDYSDKEKQFIVPVDSEVRFQLDYGTKISRGARLLVSKPKRSPDGELEYTITQPLSNEEDAEDAWAGSALDSQYLEVVDADPGASSYVLEFRVLFDASGSFFVQIVYEDERPGGGVLYSPP